MAKPARRKRVNLRVGDLFEIPLPDGKFGYGIVVRQDGLSGGGTPYIAIFRLAYDQWPSVAEITSDGVPLQGWTTDALIYHDRWKVIERDAPVPAIQFPNFKVESEGKFYVVDVVISSTWPHRESWNCSIISSAARQAFSRTPLRRCTDSESGRATLTSLHRPTCSHTLPGQPLEKLTSAIARRRKRVESRHSRCAPNCNRRKKRPGASIEAPGPSSSSAAEALRLTS